MFVQSFEEVVSSPEEWFDKAEELRYSAEILFDFEKNRTRVKREYRQDISIDTNISVISQSVMLYGMAIETLLKSIASKRHLLKIENGKLKGVSHKLISLVDELDIKLDVKDMKYLEKVIRHIEWEGRYPSPKRKIDYTEEYTKENIDKWRSYVGDVDMNKLKSIYSKIYSILEDELSLV